MDAIQLHPMRLSKAAFFRLLVKLWLRKLGWLYGVFVLVGLFGLFVLDGVSHLALILLALPLVRLAVLAWWTLNKDNRSFFEERNMTLDEQRIVTTTSSGARAEFPWSSVVRLRAIDGRYLLYLSAGQMLIVDKAAFPDQASEERFLGWLNRSIKA